MRAIAIHDELEGRRGTQARRFAIGAVATMSALALSGVTSISASSIETSAFVTPAAVASLVDSGVPSADEAEVFIGVAPVRLLDTREGIGIDAAGPLGPGESITINVVGIGGIPAEATSVALNTTFTAQATSPSFMTIWPTGEDRPYTAVNNASPGVASPNFVIAKLGDGGSIDVYNERGNAHIVLDIAGYYLPMNELDDINAGGGALWSDEGAPGPGVGEEGDFYINILTGEMYGPKTDGEWGDPMTPPTSGDQAPALLTGEGAPAAGEGDVDDMYFDLAAPAFYGPKTASGWGSAIDVGPDGFGTGSDFLVGSGAPDNGADGEDGDMYLDDDTLGLYGPKTGGEWGSAVDLGAGTGTVAEFHSGSGVPSAGLGDDGDHYIDTVDLDLYGPKSGGAWGTPTSLVTGSEFIVGSGVPDDVDDGDDGDIYFDHDTYIIYGPKVGGEWPEGSGLSSSDLLSGAGVPAGGLGGDGDHYIDTVGLDLYGPKSGGAWGTPTSLNKGSEFLVGSGGPDDLTDGDDGDMYFDEDTTTLYGPKANGEWPTGVDLNGPVMLSGVVAPDDLADGDNGDMYVDTAALKLYGPKANDEWPTGVDLNGSIMLSGVVPPNDLTDGDNGDMYIDTNTLTLYGPKAGDMWPAGQPLSGVPTASTDSAYSAYSNGVSISVAIAGSTAIAFEDDGVSVGTAISRSVSDPDTTFVFNTAGTYKVSYDLLAGLTVAGSIAIEVDGAEVPGRVVDLEALGASSATELVHADAGDTLEIVLSGVVVVGGNLDASLVVELIAVD